MEKSNAVEEKAINAETKTSAHSKELLDFYLLLLTNYQMLETASEAWLRSEALERSLLTD